MATKPRVTTVRTAKKRVTKEILLASAVPKSLMISPMRALAIRLESRLPMVVQQIGILLLLLGIGIVASTQFLQSGVATSLSQMAFAIVADPVEVAPVEPVVPEVTFNFDADFSGTQTVLAKSNTGTKMNMLLKSVGTALSITLPIASASPDTGTWTFTANTAEVPPGEYRFISRVYHNNKWYEMTSPTFTIPARTSDIGGTDNSLEFTPDAIVSGDGQAPAEITGSIFGNIPTQMTGIQLIRIAADVTDFEVVVLSSSGKVVTVLTPNRTSSTGVFNFTFDTRKVSNGEYSLQARFRFNGETVRQSGPRVTVTNLLLEENRPVATSSAIENTAENEFQINNITADPTARFQLFEFTGSNLSFIEVHTKSSAQISPVFNGLAIRQSETLWRYTIDTSKLPNGTYTLVAKYKHDGTLKTKSSAPFKVAYANPLESVEPILPVKITDSVAAINPVVEVAKAEVPVKIAPFAPRNWDFGSELSTTTLPLGVSENIKRDTITRNQDRVDDAINRITAALRSGDELAIQNAKESARSLGVSLKIDSSSTEVDSPDSIAEQIEELIARAEKIEAIVKERTEDAISLDTDGDGITDYDEITLYKTDPTNPDTDGDGFNDGAEILAGFNPLSAEAETPISYESPKVAGVSRPDLLEVTSVAAITEAEVVDDGVPAQAEISGRALPNSFITLYVFSTPVVVTLKTEADGSWLYTFDKELEDGQHEVYVGVTDNAGNLVAKSNPFRFIKEAQAFTPSDALEEVGVQNTESRGIESPLWQAAIFGLIIFIVGLILILLGQQLERSKRDNIISDV